MKTYNLQSDNGNPVPNQLVVETEGREVFLSYNTPIAVRFYDGQVVLDVDMWDYSQTTLRYLSKFLNTNGKKEIQKKIDNEEFILLPLKQIV